MAGSWLNLVAASSSTTRPASDRLASAGLAGLGPSRKSPNREVATAAEAAATARPVVSTRSRFRRVIAQALLQGGRGRFGGGAPRPDEGQTIARLYAAALFVRHAKPHKSVRAGGLGPTGGRAPGVTGPPRGEVYPV